MTIEARIDQDLKAAMLSGDQSRVSTLRGIKSAILYEKVAKGLRDTGIDDQAVTGLLMKEAKKRQESADLFRRGGDSSRAEAEIAEKSIIEQYLPQQLSDDELKDLINRTIDELGIKLPQDFGKLISVVKDKVKGSADGGRISAMIKNREA